MAEDGMRALIERHCHQGDKNEVVLEFLKFVGINELGNNCRIMAY